MDKGNFDAETVQPEQTEAQGDVTEMEEEPEPPQKPILSLRVSSDILELELELQRSGTETLNPVYEDVIQAVTDYGVVHGVDEAQIRGICEDPKFNLPYIIARGQAAATGADGYNEYLIETERDLKPKLRPDGTVDYRDLGFTQNVNQGQVLCNIHAAQKGADGMDVYGNVLEGRYGREPANVVGKNTELSEDKTQLIASVAGNAEVVKGIVNIIELLRINGNVDNSTGDLNFVGDIQINGDILSGFKVSSKGNIFVRGTVEGAVIEADGDIVVNEGINGMNRGSVIAGGNIKCKYIQSCFIKSGATIYADSIMYCMIECEGNVELGGKRGVLIGGRASVSKVLKAKTIGTDSHIATYLSMSNTDHLQKELVELQKQMTHFEAEELKLTQIFNRFSELKSQGRLTPDMEATLNMVGNNQAQLAANKQLVADRTEKVRQQQLEMSRSSNSYIECSGRIHAGVQISFGPLVMMVQQSFVFSRVSVAKEEIMITPLGGGAGAPADTTENQ
ncbi:MAG: FapA family protein [Oscillospiraceae bacterium]|jgi:uncharacterized protein (DUF342 family)|nr:FapA family protein [Oscillospiraceae bacterium]